MAEASVRQILANLPRVKDVMRIYGLVAKSQLAQNFILDPKVTDRIVDAVQPDEIRADLSGSLVVEVGPGPGMLTRSLIKAGADRILVVEKDERFRPLLEQLTDATAGRMHVVFGDMLQISGAELLQKAAVSLGCPADAPVHLVGNLPFNVASPLLIAQLRDMAGRKGLFSAPSVPVSSAAGASRPFSRPVDMTLMFQREVADRIVAPPGSAARSRLSVMAQAYVDVELAMPVPASVFVPRPKVDAAVVHFSAKKTAIEDTEGANSAATEESCPLPPFTVLEDMARRVFSQRRKTLRNNLASHYGPDIASELISKANLDRNSRPQDLTTDQVCRLATIGEAYPVLTQVAAERRR